MCLRLRNIQLLLFALILLLSSVTLFHRQICRLLLPVYAHAAQLLLPESWHISSLQFSQQGREHFFTIEVTTSAPSFMSGHVIPAGVGMSGSTLLGHALVPPLIMLSMMLAWVCLSSRLIIEPIIFMLFFLFVIVSFDVPMILVGSLYDILHINIAASSPVPWQVRTMDILNGGGRQALSLAAGFCAVSLGKKIGEWKS